MTEPNPLPAGDTADPASEAAKGHDQPMIPKARLDEEIAKRKTAETELSALADAYLADVPEALKPLIPEGLSPSKKIEWFQKAKATGVFGTPTKVPTTDNGKPRTTPQDRDLSTLPATAKIAAGFRS
jgi:hypothetical protein